MIPLPAWLPQEAWAAYLEMRKKCKKPATPWAERLALSELFNLKGLGHDPMACLNQSILKCWTDFWPPKDKGLVPAATGEHAKTTARLDADSIEARGLTKEQIAENARKVRQSLGRKPAQGELH